MLNSATMKRCVLSVSVLALAILLGGVGLLGGCSSASMENDSLTRVRDPKLSPQRRAEAAVEAWAESDPASGSGLERDAVRKTFKDIAWASNVPGQVRLAVIDQLMNETDAEGLADSRAMAKLLLPNEQNRTIVAYLCNLSAARGWTDMTPAIIRQWATVQPEEPEATRVERLAIEKLHPGVDPARTAFDVFVDPETDPGPYKLRWDLRTRAAAWDVLARLDADGSLRASLVSPQSTVVFPPDDRTLNDIRICYAEMRVVPRNGEELRWLDSLRDPAKKSNAAWWAAVRPVVAGLRDDQVEGLRLLHLEHVRWASVKRPEWVRATREELLSEMRTRMQGREIHERAIGVDYTKQVPEQLDRQAGNLCWGDVLVLLVLDDALKERALTDAIYSQITMDRSDTTTEYGGMISASSSDAFLVTMYPPRPSNRMGDRKFVASDDLISASDRGLAHYHFHVQKSQNREYAGPSEGDLDYAARLGRACIVLTSLNDSVLNVDAYFPGGYVVDLGELKR